MFGRSDFGDKAFSFFAGLGIVLIVISSLAFFYMSTMDERAANDIVEDVEEQMDVYNLVEVSSSLKQALKKATESVIMEDSNASLGNPIKIKEGGKLNIRGKSLKLYKEDLRDRIRSRFWEFVHRGDPYELADEYSYSTINYDFSKFLEKDEYGSGEDIIFVKLDEDSYKENKKLKTTVVIKNPGYGVIKQINLGSDTTLQLKLNKIEAESEIRPFTMHDSASCFYKELEANDIKGVIYGIQFLIATVEANVKGKVELAQDPKILYTLTHLLLIWKEIKCFDNFDYINIPYEAFRPWLGDPESRDKMDELLSTLKTAKDKNLLEQLSKLKKDAKSVKNWHENLILPSLQSLWKARVLMEPSVKKDEFIDWSRNFITAGILNDVDMKAELEKWKNEENVGGTLEEYAENLVKKGDLLKEIKNNIFVSVEVKLPYRLYDSKYFFVIKR